MATPHIKSHEGLLVIEESNTCLGYLMNFKEHGIFEPSLGRLDIAPADALKHNETLSKAEIKGLDENCQVGQKGTFYYTEGKGIHTFVGEIVCPNPAVTKTQIVFTRNGKTFRGKRRKDEDLFIFTRVK